MGLLILPFIILLFSSLITIVLADKSILSDTIAKQETTEHDLQDELLSLLESRVLEGGSDKRASHGKGPAPVTRVLNQVKMSKLSDTRRGNNRGGNKANSQGDWDDDDDDMMVSTSTEATSFLDNNYPSNVVKSKDSKYSSKVKAGKIAALAAAVSATSGAASGIPALPPTASVPSTPPSFSYASLTPRHLRLQKLDYYFAQLGVFSEDCRKRLLCEVAEDQTTFQPLSFVLQEETSFEGEYQHVTSEMMNTTQGARLLSYMEATLNGQDRTRGCSVFKYRCPSGAHDMINYDALVLWREMIRWLSVQVAARSTP